MKKEILIFYNKNTNKIIGFHHPTTFVVLDIKKAFVYSKRIIDVDIFLQIFIKCYPYGDKTVLKIHLKYFNNLNKSDIGYKYIDVDIFKRKYKLNKLKNIINGSN